MQGFAGDRCSCSEETAWVCSGDERRASSGRREAVESGGFLRVLDANRPQPSLLALLHLGACRTCAVFFGIVMDQRMLLYLEANTANIWIRSLNSINSKDGLQRNSLQVMKMSRTRLFDGLSSVLFPFN